MRLCWKPLLAGNPFIVLASRLPLCLLPALHLCHSQDSYRPCFCPFFPCCLPVFLLCSSCPLAQPPSPLVIPFLQELRIEEDRIYAEWMKAAEDAAKEARKAYHARRREQLMQEALAVVSERRGAALQSIATVQSREGVFQWLPSAPEAGEFSEAGSSIHSSGSQHKCHLPPTQPLLFALSFCPSHAPTFGLIPLFLHNAWLPGGALDLALLPPPPHGASSSHNHSGSCLLTPSPCPLTATRSTCRRCVHPRVQQGHWPHAQLQQHSLPAHWIRRLVAQGGAWVGWAVVGARAVKAGRRAGSARHGRGVLPKEHLHGETPGAVRVAAPDL